MEHIGVVNGQGATVLQSAPQRISVYLPNLQEDIFLDLFTGTPYTIPLGIWRGHKVEVGDYIGAYGEYRSKRWVSQHPNLWKRLG